MKYLPERFSFRMQGIVSPTPVQSNHRSASVVQNWAHLQAVIGVDLPEYSVANKMMQVNFLILVAVGSVGMLFQFVNLFR